jgi:hypothetical protein
LPNVIKIPEELAHELDLPAQAQRKRRTPYFVDPLRRDKQLQALNHPQLTQGGAAYVDAIRSEPGNRLSDSVA